MPNTADERDLGIGLCLSGGGYRAMLFHAGALARLNEAGILDELDAISSVSGGSIASGFLASCWSRLAWKPSAGPKRVASNFEDIYLRPLILFAEWSVDFRCIMHGVLVPWTSASRQLVDAYTNLFGSKANLNTLPPKPRFIFARAIFRRALCSAFLSGTSQTTAWVAISIPALTSQPP